MVLNSTRTPAILFVALSAVLFSGQLSCAAIDSISHDSLSSLMTDGTPYNFILIDLRGPADNFTEVIGNAQCRPYNLVWPDTFIARCGKIPKATNVVIYCQSGNRAGRAIAHLDSLGYTNLHNAGGFTSGFFGGWNGSRIPKSQVLSNDSLPKYSMTASTAVAVSRKLGAFRKEASVSNRLAINTLHGLNISAVNSGKAFTLKGQRLYP